ncbi:MAG: hypothetical protein RR356_08530, partial [Bacteroidales bacterium]
MNEMIQSKALEANLSRTKNVHYIIPEDHQWFIALSENYWGIHNRVVEFFKELHHPYSNRKEVVNLLVYISVTDFWIYKEVDQRDKVVKIVIDIFDKLLREKLPEELSKHLISICLDFYTNNYEILCEFEPFSTEMIQVLDRNLETNYFSYLCNIGHFRKKLEMAAHDPKTADAVLAFMRKLVERNIIFWRETSNIEKWYLDNQNKMSRDYSQTIRSIGNDFYAFYYEQLKKADSWEAICKITFTFSDIIDAFKNKIEDFKRAPEQFCYIFYLLHLPGVVYHREYLLIELNKVIKKISNEL